MATLKFKAVGFLCGKCNQLGTQAKFSDGWWTGWCVPCFAAFKKCITDWKNKKKPLWFLGGRK